MSAFARTVSKSDPSAMRALRIETLMVNVGMKCDQACSHCHQSCSPGRTELMDRAVMDLVVAVADEVRPQLVDITGGAPELNPDIRYLLSLLGASGHPMRLRTNLTALLTPEAEGLIPLLADLGVGVLASLPALSAAEYAAVRGPHFDRAIEALRRLSEGGHGRDPRLRLDIAVNRRADAAAPSDAALEREFRRELAERFRVACDDVVVITNVPVGRFHEDLEQQQSLDSYLASLRESFNPATLPHLACRTCIEVAWDGTLWDCDFNLGRGLPIAEGLPRHVSEFDAETLATRPLRFAEHCFACTAAAGSG